MQNLLDQAPQVLWDFHLELSLLLLVILSLRVVLKKAAKIYNSYWLWLVLPLTPIAMQLASYYTPPSQQLELIQQMFVTSQAYKGPLSQLPMQDVPQVENGWPTLTLLLSFWTFGAFLSVLNLGRQHRLLRKKLSAPDYQNSTELAARYPILGVSETKFSPAVYGFIKPKIYFPLALIERLNTRQIELILRHEEQHIRQGHLWLNLAWDLLVCLCWFNPLVYFARYSFRHDQELFCDYFHLEERIMNIKTQYPLFKKGALMLAIASALGISSLYAIATAHQTNEVVEQTENQISVIKIDTDNKQKMVFKVKGKTFQLEDGEQFIVENGKHREMTDAETKRFTELLDKHKRYQDSGGIDRGGIFDETQVRSFTFKHDGVIDEAELRAKLAKVGALQALSADDIKAITVIDGSGLSTEDQIEQALRRAKGSKQAAVRKARKQLEITQ